MAPNNPSRHPALCGILSLHKPPGVTSRGVVDIVQRLVKPAKAGHAGTLDPLASGVLVVCVGTATRLIEYVQQMPKSYSGTFLLGRTSPTEDVEGEVTLLADPPQPTLAEIEAATQRFLGPIDQRPPAFSALKVGGRRSYDLARAGQAVELAPRTIHIHALSVTHYAYPELQLDIECSSGTYVRSLGRDLARSLSSDAVMSALVRTAIGRFRLAESIDPQRLTRGNLPQFLLPPLCAVADLPRVVVSADENRRLANGQPIERPGTEAAAEIAAVDHAGHLVALLVPRGGGRLGPSRNISGSTTG